MSTKDEIRLSFDRLIQIALDVQRQSRQTSGFSLGSEVVADLEQESRFVTDDFTSPVQRFLGHLRILEDMAFEMFIEVANQSVRLTAAAIPVARTLVEVSHKIIKLTNERTTCEDRLIWWINERIGAFSEQKQFIEELRHQDPEQIAYSAAQMDLDIDEAQKQMGLAKKWAKSKKITTNKANLYIAPESTRYDRRNTDALGLVYERVGIAPEIGTLAGNREYMKLSAISHGSYWGRELLGAEGPNGGIKYGLGSDLQREVLLGCVDRFGFVVIGLADYWGREVPESYNSEEQLLRKLVGP